MSPAPPRPFIGEGPSRAAARAVDWSSTPLGPPDSWPVSLQTVLGIIFSSRHPMFLWWGPELIQFYNDAYLPSFGQGKHPLAMGQRGEESWQEIWSIIEPQIADVMGRATASWNEDQLVPIERNGRIEEVYWTYGYSPVFDESGAVGGVLVVCTETTAGVLAIRRLDLIRRLTTALNDAQSVPDVAHIVTRSLDQARLDVPFSVVGFEGLPPLVTGLDGVEAAPSRGAPVEPAPARRILDAAIVCEPWPEPVREVVEYPLDVAAGGTITFGLSPRLLFNAAYRSFLQQIVEQVVIASSRISADVERRRLLLQAPVATALLTGPDHVFEIANPRYIEMVGREVVGRSYLEAFPETVGTELLDILTRVYRDGERFVTQEMRIPLVSGEGGVVEDRFFNFNLEPIRDVRGKVYGMMAVAVDITAQVSARSAIERSHAERSHLLEAAQVASRAKDQFLAMLGHELRNPLAPILTALEVMKIRKVAGSEREREIIERQASNLVTLVDDLLDVARVAEGKIELRKRRIALADVVASALETASPLLEKNRHELRVSVEHDGLDVLADATRLAQVVANLLTNAARYTDPSGTITIRAERVDEHAVLRVEDTGIGLENEQIPHLFERFFQGPRSSDRVHGGLGLGLALVKSLTELHGGSVRAESAGLGKGSAFELRLPLAQGEREGGGVALANAPSEPRPARGQRVLLIDDNPDITELFAAILQASGFDVQTAHDGPSALRLAAEHEPAVAILDLGLPVMNGYEIAAKLIEQLGPAAPRLIAMSGYGTPDDIARTRRAGFERHLVKPVDAASLLRAIEGA